MRAGPARGSEEPWAHHLSAGVPLREGLWDPALPSPMASSCSLVRGPGGGRAAVFGVNLQSGWLPLHTTGSPSSSCSSCAFPGRSDPGEPRDERRPLITVIYYFLRNGCYETWGLVPGTTGSMRKVAPARESCPRRPRRPTWEGVGGAGQAGLWPEGAGLRVAAPFCLREPPGRKGAGFGGPWLQGGRVTAGVVTILTQEEITSKAQATRRGMSSEKIPGPQGDQTKWDFNRSLPAQISRVIGSRSRAESGGGWPSGLPGP